MTVDERVNDLRRTLRTAGRVCFSLALTTLAACGGSLGNPPDVNNSGTTGGQKLAFAYFQQCVNPIFFKIINSNTCAASGCHDNANGTGGALRVVSAAAVDVQNPANTADVIRATDMYKNFFSSQGQVLLASPQESRLINKPLVRNVLHGGGQIFLSDQDPDIKVIEYWITHPAPQGQDEFSPATWNMFADGNPNGTQCRTQ
jgi:hypothetical protein